MRAIRSNKGSRRAKIERRTWFPEISSHLRSNKGSRRAKIERVLTPPVLPALLLYSRSNKGSRRAKIESMHSLRTNEPCTTIQTEAIRALEERRLRASAIYILFFSSLLHFLEAIRALEERRLRVEWQVYWFAQQYTRPLNEAIRALEERRLRVRNS